MKPLPEAVTLVHELRARLDAELRDVGLQGRTVALLDWPHHTNSGDSAIWTGQVDTLRRLGARIAYRSSVADFSAQRLRECVPADGVVLLCGGGSFGDLYPATQRFRHVVLESLPDRRIVQLPQSLHFDDEPAAAGTRAAIAAHPDFTLMVRDHASLDVAQQLLGCEARLCPDAAFGIETVRERDVSTARVWLMRGDIERAAQPVVDPEGLVTDWPGTETPEQRSRGAVPGRLILQVLFRRERLDVGPVHVGDVLAQGFDPLARRRLARGLDLLGQGAVVVTDRLHGHILSLLLGRPQVILDNRIGKLSKFHSTWTSGTDVVRLAESPAEALDLSRELAQRR
jgi:pyruvyl transferase EpsO